METLPHVRIQACRFFGIELIKKCLIGSNVSKFENRKNHSTLIYVVPFLNYNLLYVRSTTVYLVWMWSNISCPAEVVFLDSLKMAGFVNIDASLFNPFTKRRKKDLCIS